MSIGSTSQPTEHKLVRTWQRENLEWMTECSCGAIWSQEKNEYTRASTINLQFTRRVRQARSYQAAMKESVNHPEHYGGDTTYEAIKVIEAWELGFCLGNAVKYICRAGKKDTPLLDLEKARWYIDREITRRKG